jgi:hypothetical protein
MDHVTPRKRLLLFVATAALCVAAPVSAQPTYGGIGASVSRFYGQNAHASGKPTLGVAYYRIDDERAGRVAAYHVVLDVKSKLTDAELRRLVTGRELPVDVKEVQGWKYAQLWHGYCAIYKSRWLGRLLYGPYVVLYVSRADQTAFVMVSTAPACRG